MTAPPLSRILAELLGGTRSSPPEAPSQYKDRASDQCKSQFFALTAYYETQKFSVFRIYLLLAGKTREGTCYGENTFVGG